MENNVARFNRSVNNCCHNNPVRSRIDTSAPKSFYCSPKSYHYIPFAQRRSHSADSKRFGSDEAQCRPRSRLSEQSRTYLRSRQGTSLKRPSISSANMRVAFADSKTVRSKIAQSKNYQQPLLAKQESEILSNRPSTAVRNVYQADNSDQLRERVDQFKDDVLSDIIRRGVYTDRVIQDCISRNVARNQFLTMTVLLEAISDLLTDIGISNKKALSLSATELVGSLDFCWNANVEKCSTASLNEPQMKVEEVLSYEGEEFDSDEGDSLSVIESARSDSITPPKAEESAAANSKSDSVTTTFSSSAPDTP